MGAKLAEEFIFQRIPNSSSNSIIRLKIYIISTLFLLTLHIVTANTGNLWIFILNFSGISACFDF